MKAISKKYELSSLVVVLLVGCGDGGYKPYSLPATEGEPTEASQEEDSQSLQERLKLQCGYEFEATSSEDRFEFLDKLSGAWVSSFPGFLVKDDPDTGKKVYIKDGFRFDDYNDIFGQVSLYYSSPIESEKLNPNRTSTTVFGYFDHKLSREITSGPNMGYRILQMEKGEFCQTLAIKYDKDFDYILIKGSQYRSSTKRPSADEYLNEISEILPRRYDRTIRFSR